MSAPIDRFWDVGGSIPPNKKGNDKSWARTFVVHVVAESAKLAVEAVECEYPDIVVHTVQHRGPIDIIYGARRS